MGMFGLLRGIHRNLVYAAAISALAFWISGCAGLVESQTKPADPAGAPAISGVTITQVTSTGAMISWATDQAASSQVDFGTTTSYGSSSALNTAMVSSHSVSLSGLKASTLYYYRVESTNSAGNMGTSGDFTFTTASGSDTTPPKVSIT